MSLNRRIYYATKGLAVKTKGTPNNRFVLPLAASGFMAASQSPTGPSWEVPRGVQTVGITTTFNLDNIFQEGQLATYEQFDNKPDIEVTVNRVLDGTHPLYLAATDDNGFGIKEPFAPGTALGLAARISDYPVDLALQIYHDDVSNASGVASRPAVSRVLCSGMFLSSITYTFPVDGPSTEDCTFVGNNKFWSVDSTVPGTAPIASFPDEDLINTDEDPTLGTFPKAGYQTGVTFRQHVRPHGTGASLFPTDIPVNDRSEIQTITVSADFGQTEILALGQKSAFTRYVEFPVEITASFEVVTSDGDMIEANENSVSSNRTIVIETDMGLKLDLGTKNKLTAINFSGGDTGGGNVSVTYDYKNSNALTISHANFV